MKASTYLLTRSANINRYNNSVTCSIDHCLFKVNQWLFAGFAEEMK